MMDRSELILQALAAACAATGYPVEIDREAPLEDADAPLVIVRSGDEGAAAIDHAKWWSRWQMKPTVQIYVSVHDAAAARAALNAAWSAIITGIRNGEVSRLISPKTPIEMDKATFLRDGDFYAQEMTFGFTFDR